MTTSATNAPKLGLTESQSASTRAQTPVVAVGSAKPGLTVVAPLDPRLLGLQGPDVKRLNPQDLSNPPPLPPHMKAAFFQSAVEQVNSQGVTLDLLKTAASAYRGIPEGLRAERNVLLGKQALEKKIGGWLQPTFRERLNSAQFEELGEALRQLDHKAGIEAWKQEQQTRSDANAAARNKLAGALSRNGPSTGSAASQQDDSGQRSSPAAQAAQEAIAAVKVGGEGFIESLRAAGTSYTAYKEELEKNKQQSDGHVDKAKDKLSDALFAWLSSDDFRDRSPRDLESILAQCNRLGMSAPLIGNPVANRMKELVGEISIPRSKKKATPKSGPRPRPRPALLPRFKPNPSPSASSGSREPEPNLDKLLSDFRESYSASDATFENNREGQKSLESLIQLAGQNGKAGEPARKALLGIYADPGTIESTRKDILSMAYELFNSSDDPWSLSMTVLYLAAHAQGTEDKELPGKKDLISFITKKIDPQERDMLGNRMVLKHEMLSGGLGLTNIHVWQETVQLQTQDEDQFAAIAAKARQAQAPQAVWVLHDYHWVTVIAVPTASGVEWHSFNTLSGDRKDMDARLNALLNSEQSPFIAHGIPDPGAINVCGVLGQQMLHAVEEAVASKSVEEAIGNFIQKWKSLDAPATRAAVLATRAELLQAAVDRPEADMQRGLAASVTPSAISFVEDDSEYRSAMSELKVHVQKLVEYGNRSLDVNVVGQARRDLDGQIAATYAAAVRAAKVALDSSTARPEHQHHGLVARVLDRALKEMKAERTLLVPTDSIVRAIFSSLDQKSILSIVSSNEGQDPKRPVPESVAIAAEYVGNATPAISPQAHHIYASSPGGEASSPFVPSTSATPTPTHSNRVDADENPADPGTNATQRAREKTRQELGALLTHLSQIKDKGDSDAKKVLAVRDAWKPVAQAQLFGDSNEAARSGYMVENYREAVKQMVGEHLSAMPLDDLALLQEGLNARNTRTEHSEAVEEFLGLIQKMLAAELRSKMGQYVDSSIFEDSPEKQRYDAAEKSALGKVRDADRAARQTAAAIWAPARGVSEKASQLGTRALNAIAPFGRNQSKVRANEMQTRRAVGQLLGAVMTRPDNKLAGDRALETSIADLRRLARLEGPASNLETIKAQLEHQFALATTDQLKLLHAGCSELKKSPEYQQHAYVDAIEAELERTLKLRAENSRVIDGPSRAEQAYAQHVAAALNAILDGDFAIALTALKSASGSVDKGQRPDEGRRLAMVRNLVGGLRRIDADRVSTDQKLFTLSEALYSALLAFCRTTPPIIVDGLDDVLGDLNMIREECGATWEVPPELREHVGANPDVRQANDALFEVFGVAAESRVDASAEPTLTANVQSVISNAASSWLGAMAGNDMVRGYLLADPADADPRQLEVMKGEHRASRGDLANHRVAQIKDHTGANNLQIHALELIANIGTLRNVVDEAMRPEHGLIRLPDGRACKLRGGERFNKFHFMKADGSGNVRVRCTRDIYASHFETADGGEPIPLITDRGDKGFAHIEVDITIDHSGLATLSKPIEATYVLQLAAAPVTDDKWQSVLDQLTSESSQEDLIQKDVKAIMGLRKLLAAQGQAERSKLWQSPTVNDYLARRLDGKLEGVAGMPTDQLRNLRDKLNRIEAMVERQPSAVKGWTKSGAPTLSALNRAIAMVLSNRAVSDRLAEKKLKEQAKPEVRASAGEKASAVSDGEATPTISRKDRQDNLINALARLYANNRAGESLPPRASPSRRQKVAKVQMTEVDLRNRLGKLSTIDLEQIAARRETFIANVPLHLQKDMRTVMDAVDSKLAQRKEDIKTALKRLGNPTIKEIALGKVATAGFTERQQPSARLVAEIAQDILREVDPHIVFNQRASTASSSTLSSSESGDRASETPSDSDIRARGTGRTSGSARRDLARDFSEAAEPANAVHMTLARLLAAKSKKLQEYAEVLIGESSTSEQRTAALEKFVNEANRQLRKVPAEEQERARMAALVSAIAVVGKIGSDGIAKFMMIVDLGVLTSIASLTPGSKGEQATLEMARQAKAARSFMEAVDQATAGRKAISEEAQLEIADKYDAFRKLANPDANWLMEKDVAGAHKKFMTEQLLEARNELIRNKKPGEVHTLRDIVQAAIYTSIKAGMEDLSRIDHRPGERVPAFITESMMRVAKLFSIYGTPSKERDSIAPKFAAQMKEQISAFQNLFGSLAPDLSEDEVGNLVRALPNSGVDISVVVNRMEVRRTRKLDKFEANLNAVLDGLKSGTYAQAIHLLRQTMVLSEEVEKLGGTGLKDRRHQESIAAAMRSETGLNVLRAIHYASEQMKSQDQALSEELSQMTGLLTGVGDPKLVALEDAASDPNAKQTLRDVWQLEADDQGVFKKISSWPADCAYMEPKAIVEILDPHAPPELRRDFTAILETQFDTDGIHCLDALDAYALNPTIVEANKIVARFFLTNSPDELNVSGNTIADIRRIHSSSDLTNDQKVEELSKLFLEARVSAELLVKSQQNRLNELKEAVRNRQMDGVRAKSWNLRNEAARAANEAARAAEARAAVAQVVSPAMLRIDIDAPSMSATSPSRLSNSAPVVTPGSPSLDPTRASRPSASGSASFLRTPPPHDRPPSPGGKVPLQMLGVVKEMLSIYARKLDDGPDKDAQKQANMHEGMRVFLQASSDGIWKEEKFEDCCDEAMKGTQAIGDLESLCSNLAENPTTTSMQIVSAARRRIAQIRTRAIGELSRSVVAAKGGAVDALSEARAVLKQIVPEVEPKDAEVQLLVLLTADDLTKKLGNPARQLLASLSIKELSSIVDSQADADIAKLAHVARNELAERAKEKLASLDFALLDVTTSWPHDPARWVMAVIRADAYLTMLDDRDQVRLDQGQSQALEASREKLQRALTQVVLSVGNEFAMPEVRPNERSALVSIFKRRRTPLDSRYIGFVEPAPSVVAGIASADAQMVVNRNLQKLSTTKHEVVDSAAKGVEFSRVMADELFGKEVRYRIKNDGNIESLTGGTTGIGLIHRAASELLKLPSNPAQVSAFTSIANKGAIQGLLDSSQSFVRLNGQLGIPEGKGELEITASKDRNGALLAKYDYAVPVQGFTLPNPDGDESLQARGELRMSWEVEIDQDGKPRLLSPVTYVHNIESASSDPAVLL